jgi:hypothetical protein
MEVAPISAGSFTGLTVSETCRGEDEGEGSIHYSAGKDNWNWKRLGVSKCSRSTVQSDKTKRLRFEGCADCCEDENGPGRAVLSRTYSQVRRNYGPMRSGGNWELPDRFLIESERRNAETQGDGHGQRQVC